MQKLYCYVDESGQDTAGEIFLVSIVIVGNERDQLEQALLAIEAASGKGKNKWMKSRPITRIAYIRAIAASTLFEGSLYYGLHRQSQEYVDLTVTTTALAIQRAVAGQYKATVIVDGLRKEERLTFGTTLRRRGIRTEKIRGADDQKDAFVRLADALCGFIRDAEEGQTEYQTLLERMMRRGLITRV